MPKLDVETVRRAVLANRYFIPTHAKQRMGLRNVTDEDLKPGRAGRLPHGIAAGPHPAWDYQK